MLHAISLSSCNAAGALHKNVRVLGIEVGPRTRQGSDSRLAAPAVRHMSQRRVIAQPARASAAASGQSEEAAYEETVDWTTAVATAATVGLSAVLAIAPRNAFSRAVVAIPTAATQLLLQHAAVSVWPVAAILYVLGDAARHQRLSSDTYQRLASFAAFGFGAAAISVAAPFGDLGVVWKDTTLVTSLVFALAAVPAVGAVAAILAGVKAKGASSSWAGSQAAAVQSAFKKLTAANQGGEGTLYQGLTFVLPLALPLLVFRSALGGWLWPLERVAQLGPVHSLLLKVVALEAIGAAFAAFSLKDAENRGRLGGGTFKLLRQSLGAAALGNGLVAALARSATTSTLNKVASAGLGALTATVVLRWLAAESKRFEKK